MRRPSWMLCLGVIAGSAGVVTGIGARPIAAGQTPPAEERPTFRAGTRLATIDAVVVDQQGRHVTDLSSGDFEVVERGKRQAIRQALYVRVAGSTGGADATSAAAPARLLSGTLPAAARTGRVLAIVVDDLGLSFESVAHTRKMLATCLDTAVADGDLVAIIRTSGGTGALQQFTTDRRLLRAAAERVRWTSQSRQDIGAFAPSIPDVVASRRVAPGSARSGTEDPTATPERYGSIEEGVDDLRRDSSSSGSLGVLHYILRGIESLPGRKSVIFVSEGFDMGIDAAAGRDRASRDRRGRSWDAFTRVTDRANRAGVVLYAIDPRGLPSTGMAAQDTVHLPGGLNDAGDAGAFTQRIADTARERLRELDSTQQSLVHLAERTGGFAVINQNNLGQGLSRITEDMRGYYLIGFDTGLQPSVAWDPADVRIRVTRPGLVIRARRGLFGPADPRSTPIVPDDPLVAAALSPFDAGSIDVRLTGVFGFDPKTGPYVHAMFVIDPATISFVDAADGGRQARFSLLLLAIGDDGVPVGRVRRQVEMTLQPEAYTAARQSGLLYTERLPIKNPGGYQVRAAIRDERARQVGTSAQFIDVPRVGKGRLALSGVVMTDVATARRSVGLEGAGTAPTGPAQAGALASPATKVFSSGTDVVYACDIYDGRGRRGTPLTTQTTLLRDGRAIFTGPLASVAGTAAADERVGVLAVSGSLILGHDLSPGVYSLQVRLAESGKKRPAATQWVDFEIR